MSHVQKLIKKYKASSPNNLDIVYFIVHNICDNIAILHLNYAKRVRNTSFSWIMFRGLSIFVNIKRYAKITKI